MSKPEQEFHQPAGAWQPGEIPGTWTQVLALDLATGAYTGLLRYEPGVDTGAQGTRTHEYWEEVYILDGEFTDLRLGASFTAGMYACRPPGMPHGPWRSAKGALMLELRYRNPQ